MRYKSQQSGVALITALIITSIAVSLAGMAVYRQQIQIRLSSNISHLEQAYLYATGMEDWAGTILLRSHNDHQKYDSLKDDWATLLPPIPIPGGVMNGQLFDLQARINLNSLARPKPPQNQAQQNPNQPRQQNQPQGNQGNQGNNRPTPPDIAAITATRLTNLIAEIDPDQSMGPQENFVDILSDWIDKDQDTRDFGAESDYYQSLEPAYFAPNALLATPTELRMLKDMKKEVYEKLLEQVSTLPITINTPINMNTASIEVIKAIGFDQGSAEEIIKERDIRPFRKKKEFTDYITNNSNITVRPENFQYDVDVSSQFFLLRGNVRINNTRLFINSVLERKNGQVSVIMRDFSNP